jgi:ketosteroid isomerase-like protein
MKPIDALKASFAAWEARDPAALAGLFAEEGAFVDPLKPAVLVGPGQIEAGNRDAMAILEDVRITIDLAFENDNHGAVEGVFQSRLADGGGRFDFPFMASVEMRDGRIERLSEYFDTKGLVP